MIRRIIIEEEADTEFVEAMRWYERNGAGLGWRFLRAVDAGIKLVESHPDLGSPVGNEIRRTLLKHFPYWIYYRVRQDELRVIACFHTKRSPDEMDSRIH